MNITECIYLYLLDKYACSPLVNLNISVYENQSEIRSDETSAQSMLQLLSLRGILLYFKFSL